MNVSARLAWSSFAVTIALLGAQTFFVLASGTPLNADDGGLNSFPLITFATGLSAGVGALIASRHPGNRVGLLFCVGPMGTATGLAAEAFASAVQLYGLPGPGWLVEPALVASYGLGAVWAITMVSAVLLVVPDGRLPSRRWRPVAASLPLPFLVAMVVLVVFASTHVLKVNQDDTDAAWYFVVPLFGAWGLLALTLAASTTSLVQRLRRSSGVLHQQLRWIAAAATALLAGTVITLGGSDVFEDRSWAWALVLPLYLGYLSVPVAVGFAVLRHRLYDIDLVISRAAMLALLLAFVVTGYTVAVVTLSGVLGERFDASFWPSLAATAVVALAFQPLRSRAVRLADRLAYGSRAAPYDALATFARHLQAAPDPSSLLHQVAAAVGRAVGARQVSAVLELPEHGETCSTWSARGGQVAGPVRDGGRPPLVFTIEDRGERLGRVEVGLPAGASLRKHEGPVVERLLDQSALALRNLRLEAELAAQVAELDRRTTALAASRRRLVIAGDEAKARFSLDLRGRVLPHLAPLPGRLSSLGKDSPERIGAGLSLRGEQEAAAAALDELRRLVHGMAPGGGQGADASQAAVSRSGPNADFVT